MNNLFFSLLRRVTAVAGDASVRQLYHGFNDTACHYSSRDSADVLVSHLLLEGHIPDALPL